MSRGNDLFVVFKARESIFFKKLKEDQYSCSASPKRKMEHEGGQNLSGFESECKDVGLI